MKQKDRTTEERILQVARQAFIRKGLSGARMQDIADEAGINKALVHYYFESKEKLFALIFEEEFARFFSTLAAVVTADIPLFEKIEQVVILDLERLAQFPEMPLFVINEISRNPSMIVKRLKHLRIKEVMAMFQKQVNAEVRKGIIKKITAQQLLLNIQALCIFPFIGKPMLKHVFKMGDKEFRLMIQARKTEVVKFIIDAIKA